MKERLIQLKKEFDTHLHAAKTKDAIERMRIAFLGRNGTITSLMAELKDFSAEEKKIYGPLFNGLKQECTQALAQKEKEIEKIDIKQHYAREQHFDVTAYRAGQPTGTLHLYTHLIEQLEDIFISMGYTIADGPEVETDYYNFEALNIPAHHPARDLHDTFWLDVPGMLLRTHTSTVQIHAMQQQKPPLAIFAPGRVYRNEATDASHDFMFMQGEALVIDKDISVAHLLSTAQTFLRAFFNNEAMQLRVRPGYFPFVEPGLEVDASCPFCTNGCSVCKYTQWIELGGAGLVHPHVLQAGNINPDIYAGFAFGFGLDRLIMIKYAIPDGRLLKSNKIHFLSEF